jgi:hypothetical protein
MKYLNKYVRFFEVALSTKTKDVAKPVDPLPIANESDVVERLSRIYKNLDDTEKRDIDSYFE